VLLKLRRNAAVLDELDIACSFAALAQEQNLVRPILNLGLDIFQLPSSSFSFCVAGLIDF
jgi:DNA mismatch repair ATPase MutS